MDSILNQISIDEKQLKEAKDEVLRKIGRNVLLFQQMELALKALVGTFNISGYASELKAKQASKIESIKTQTMGQLIGEYAEHNSLDQNDNNGEPENLKKPYFSLSFRVETDIETHTKQKALMASIVKERNDLIHHFLPTYESTSINGCKSAHNRLDEQADRVRTEINNFRAILTSFDEARKDMADFLGSKEGKEYIVSSFAEQSSLASILVDLTQTKARADGWLELSKAASIINVESPDELKNLKQNHGCKKLRDMMVKTKLFEFTEEKTAKGSRVLYRLNQG
jgi:hypothetical protein